MNYRPNIIINGTIHQERYTPATIGIVPFTTFPVHYEQDTRSILMRINQSVVGHILIEEITVVPGRIIIIPPSNPFDANAYATVLPSSVRDPLEQNRLLRNATRVGTTVYFYERNGTSIGLRDPNGVMITGRGQGVEMAIIEFISYTSERGRGYPNTFPTISGTTPQGTLFHEMIHALRLLRGVFSYEVADEGLTLEQNFDGFDEFCAILIANIYNSELGLPLRANHHGIETLALTEEVFFERYETQIAQVVTDLQGLAMAIAGIARNICPFNPIRRMFYPRERVRHRD